MSDHHGHHHDHGGDGPPWFNHLAFWLTIGLIIMMLVVILMGKLHLLPD